MSLNMGTDQKFFTMLDTRKLPRRSISLIGPYIESNFFDVFFYSLIFFYYFGSLGIVRIIGPY